MGITVYQEIKDSLRRLSVEDAQRKKLVAILSTDTHVEIPAIVGIVETTLARINRISHPDRDPHPLQSVSRHISLKSPILLLCCIMR
jgi:hypothetical protein